MAMLNNQMVAPSPQQTSMASLGTCHNFPCLIAERSIESIESMAGKKTHTIQ